MSQVATGAVSLEEVLHVAELANLALTAEELPMMARDLNAILGHIAELSELDTTGVEPMAQVSQVLGLVPALQGESLRADVERPCVDRNAVMAEAPETDGRFLQSPQGDRALKRANAIASFANPFCALLR